MPTFDESLSFQHLQSELQRIDLLIRREVRRWEIAGQDPEDKFRGLYLPQQQAAALANRPFGESWGHTVALPQAEAAAFTVAMTETLQQTRTLSAQAQAQGRTLRLAHLTAACALDPFALDTLLICLAPQFDLRYERLYGYLQDDVTQKYPTINLVLDLLCPPGAARLEQLSHFAEHAPLFTYRLLTRVPTGKDDPGSLLGRPLMADPAIVAWLLGQYQPPEELKEWSSLHPPTATENEALLARTVWQGLRTILRQNSGRPPLLVFHGPDQATQHAAARLSAAQLERPLLQVTLAPAIERGLPPLTAIQLALRDARLNAALPYLTGWDACMSKDEPATALLTELYNYPSPLIVSSATLWQAQGPARERALLWVDFPLPEYTQRLTLWKHFTALALPATLLDYTALASQFTLSTAQISSAVATARDLAVQQGRSPRIEDFFAAARAHSNPRLADLARKITPRYSWSDIILPTDQLCILQEIVAAVRGRAKVLEEWKVGQRLAASNGVAILFAGPPGTGKTMAAEVIAAELGLDLYKIDLSTIVSKYIGETEQNLERIFNEAQSSNAILFFDEADALFGKRSEVKDAHDRYANIEVSYLLQRMEAYDGVTILATNLRANLDEAFTRRLQFAIDFPFPEEDDRQRIWETLFPPDAPRAPDLDFALLARRFKLAGGNIRNIIVTAAFLAAADNHPITMRHLLHAARRELQKIGRLVKESDMEWAESCNVGISRL